MNMYCSRFKIAFYGYVKREIGELLCRETKKHHKKEGVPKNIGTPSFMQYFFLSDGVWEILPPEAGGIAQLLFNTQQLVVFADTVGAAG